MADLNYQKINTASLIATLEEDFYLIGWRGSDPEVAPLIAISSATLRAAIAGSSQQNSTTLYAAPRPQNSAAVSVEELFDQLHHRYKTAYIAVEIPKKRGNVKIADRANWDGASVEIKQGDREHIYMQLGEGIMKASLHITAIGTGAERPYIESFDPQTGVAIVVAPVGFMGVVNITAQVPFVAGAPNITFQTTEP